MSPLADLLRSNRAWAARLNEADATFFQRLAAQQSPKYLWIGCADSRVPATQLVDLLPGEMFVHRNVANLVTHADLNALAVIQFAVEALRVETIIVCGHYGCGGVQAAAENRKLGLIDNWLRLVQEIAAKHRPALDAIADDGVRLQRLCELNVVEQVVNVCQTTIVQDAWARGQPLAVCGLVYGLEDGILRDLEICIGAPDEVAPRYRAAIQAILGQPSQGGGA